LSIAAADSPRSKSAEKPGRTLPWQNDFALNVTMIVMLIYFFLPLFWLVVSATKTNSQLFSSFGLWFANSFNIVDNLKMVFAQDNGVFLRWMGNTAMYAGVSAAGATALAASAGYAVSRLEFTGRKVYFAVIIGTIMVPTTALAIPSYLVMSRLGLVNGPLAIILPSLVSPIGLYLMTVFARDAIPVSVLEAARIDGASEYRIFLQIAVPLLGPGLVTVFLLTLVATWNNYFLPLIMLSDPKWYPITLGLASWNSQAAAGNASQALFSVVITGALVSIIPLVIAFVVLQRYWQSGVAMGAVKE
jgi:multiple sugar transport system permease protein